MCFDIQASKVWTKQQWLLNRNVLTNPKTMLKFDIGGLITIDFLTIRSRNIQNVTFRGENL